MGAGKVDSIPDLVHRIDGLIALLETQDINRGANTQTVIHKSNSAGFIAGFAIAACIACLAITYESSRSVRNEMERQNKDLRDDIRDLKAWNDVNRGKIAKLEAAQTR